MYYGISVSYVKPCSIDSGPKIVIGIVDILSILSFACAFWFPSEPHLLHASLINCV